MVPDDTEDEEEIVDIDGEAELFFASRGTVESSDSDDEVEFIGMSEAPGPSQPARKRPRNASPRPDTPASDSGPSTERPASSPPLVVSRSIDFKIGEVRDVLKAQGS